MPVISLEISYVRPLSIVLAILIADIEVLPVVSISAGLVVGLAGEILLLGAAGLSARAVFSAIAMACDWPRCRWPCDGRAVQTRKCSRRGHRLCTWISGGIFLISGLHLRCLGSSLRSCCPTRTAGLHEAALQSVLLAVGACTSSARSSRVLHRWLG